MQQKVWKYRDNSPFINVLKRLEFELGVPEKIALLLAQREIDNFESAKSFFRPSWTHTHSPFLMLNMQKAVKRIEKAIQDKEKIMVYGDYDVDGTTAVAMLYDFLNCQTSNLSYYIPNRYTEGYGVSDLGIDTAIHDKVGLIITLDCGIKANDKIKRAKENNIDVIVCDHHLPGLQLPQAIILNPKQLNCPYPFKELSGAGVGFKLIQAICESWNLSSENYLKYLDLLAIGTGADLVSLRDENRIFTFLGLEKINVNPSAGISALLKVSNCSIPINIRDIGFSIAPRINAAGRIDDAKKIIELLCSGDVELTLMISKAISEENEYRRELDQEITREALSVLYSTTDFENKKSTVLYQSHWNKGVVGIVASRIQEKIYKPTIVLTQSNGKISGSARSVKGFNIHDAIASCEHLLESYGGHAFAAGLTMQAENLKEFIQAFEMACSGIKNEQLLPDLLIDSSIEFEELSDKFFRILWQFEPFGPDNLAPIFCTQGVVAFNEIKVLAGKHLKFRVCQENNPNIQFEAIAFNQLNHMEKIKSGIPFDLCYTPELNTWNNKKTIQLNVKDIK